MRRSFQDHRNYMITSEASTGTERGRTIAVKVRSVVAPSSEEDSNSDSGNEDMKPRIKNTPKGIVNPTW